MWFKKKEVTPAGPCTPAKPYFNYYTGECVATEEEIRPRGVTAPSTPKKKAPAKKAPAKKAPAKKAPKKK